MIQTNFIQQSTSPMEPTGTWINTKTGETITIKTMVNDMSGNGSQLMLTDGRLISFTEFSNNYIQMEEDSTNQQNDMMSNTTKETPRLNIDLLTAGLGQDNNITNMYHMSETPVELMHRMCGVQAELMHRMCGVQATLMSHIRCMTNAYYTMY